jgi:hypothetical protein
LINKEIKMAIVLNPITLPASKMLATMTTLIGDVRFNDTLAPSDLVNELVDSSRIGKVDYGKGIVYTFKLAPQPVNDLSEESSAFTITKPNVAQETITIDNYKVIPISMSEILSRDSALSGTTINEFFSFVMSLLEDTAKFYMYDVVNGLYQGWEPTQATQTILVDQIDTTGLTGADLNQALIWNSNEMAKVMRKTVNNMKIPNSKYTDVATYVDANTGDTESVVSALRTDDLKLVMNDKYWTDFMASSLASLYHSEKIGDMIPGDKFVLLPEDAMAEGNEDVIGWLSDKKKFAFADFYRVTLSILDPSTTYQNTFLHFSYGAGVFTYAPGVKFVANVITQEP